MTKHILSPFVPNDCKRLFNKLKKVIQSKEFLCGLSVKRKTRTNYKLENALSKNLKIDDLKKYLQPKIVFISHAKFLQAE
jgi:hypothetical protein